MQTYRQFKSAQAASSWANVPGGAPPGAIELGIGPEAYSGPDLSWLNGTQLMNGLTGEVSTGYMEDDGPGEFGEDLGQGNGEGPDPDFFLISPTDAWWPGKEEGEPSPFEQQSEPVRTATDNTGPVRSVGATNVQGMNPQQMATDAAANVAQPRTTNGRRNGRNLVGSPHVTLPGYKPGNRERLSQPSTPTVKQNAAPIRTVQPRQPTQLNPSGAPKLESYAEFKGQNK